MSTVLQILQTPWAIALMIFFFGASIFVHELGHFLAARWRGLKVERFAVGFGPKIWAKKINGVEYIVGSLPLGGYVALPQLADLRGVEGDSEFQQEDLPPISYTDKVIVASAGAVFNVLFAILIGGLLWAAGTYTAYSSKTTTIGYVSPTVAMENGEDPIPSPASEAGLLPGDRILSIDGQPMSEWSELQIAIITGGGRSEDGRPMTELEIERDGQVQTLTVYPVLRGTENTRLIGVAARDLLVIESLYANSPAERAGLQSGDEIIALEGKPILSAAAFRQIVDAHGEKPLEITFRRGENELTSVLVPEEVTVSTDGQSMAMLGVLFKRRAWLEHVDPVTRVVDDILLTWRILGALFSRGADLGVEQLSGPIGIGYVLFQTARLDWRALLELVILININLAILNMLPIPVLDGGHIAFATFAKLRGKALPGNLIAGTQMAFMALLLTFVIYVSLNDVFRIARIEGERQEVREERARAIVPVFEGETRQEG